MMFVDGKLAAWLVKELNIRGWSHRELARRSDLSQTTVSDVISEKRPATWDFCAAVARAMGISVDEVERVLAASKVGPMKVRNYALVCTFLDSGIRNSELCALQIGDPYTLQYLLGHEDMTVTREYVKIAAQDAADLYQSPLDSIL